MNVYDYIILALVLVGIVSAVIFSVRRRKKGGGCCGSCQDCQANCKTREIKE